MLPAKPSFDVRHLLPGYVEYLGDVPISARHHPNLEHLTLIELCHAVSFSALWFFAQCVVCMLRVFAICASFKISNVVICLDSILVVGMRAIRIGVKKRIRHQPVHKAIVDNAVLAEPDDNISITRSCFEHFQPVVACIRNYAFYSSKVANLIVRKLLDYLPCFSETCFRHLRPFSSRLRLLRCAWRAHIPSGVPSC